MATMVTGTKSLPKKSTQGGTKIPGPNGNGSRRDGHGDDFHFPDSDASRYRIGMWVAIAAILMMFTALTSAYIVRAASANDWLPLPVPRVLWLSTALILISSVTLEIARRSIKRHYFSQYRNWLGITTVLGAGFLVAQLLVWRALVRQGVYIASNPHSSFFYLLTATHGLHLAGGLLALFYLLVRQQFRRQDETLIGKRIAAADAVTLYWHFMDALWIYLFLLLFVWR
jgi:cytochrome c oxidase subunit III